MGRTGSALRKLPGNAGRSLTTAVALLLALEVSPARAEGANKLLNMCQACHGELGRNDYPNIPNLRWQNKAYLVKQLQAYKTGERRDKTMTRVAQLLADEDIQQMAEFFYIGQEQ